MSSNHAFCTQLDPSIRPKGFELAFPELSTTTEGIGDFTFDQLFRVLNSRLDDDFEALQLFGAKFQMRSLVLIGTPLILLIQLYLLLHLHELNERAAIYSSVGDDPEPWIGSYRARTACFVTLNVVGVVPLIAQVALLFKGLPFLE